MAWMDEWMTHTGPARSKGTKYSTIWRISMAWQGVDESMVWHGDAQGAYARAAKLSCTITRGHMAGCKDVCHLILIHPAPAHTLIACCTRLRPQSRAHASGSAHLLALNGFWHISGGDLLRQALRHRGLSHTRLANEARVVFGTAAQNLDHALNLLLTAHHRVQLALRAIVLLRQPGVSMVCSSERVQRACAGATCPYACTPPPAQPTHAAAVSAVPQHEQPVLCHSAVLAGAAAAAD